MKKNPKSDDSRKRLSRSTPKPTKSTDCTKRGPKFEENDLPESDDEIPWSMPKANRSRLPSPPRLTPIDLPSARTGVTQTSVTKSDLIALLQDVKKDIMHDVKSEIQGERFFEFSLNLFDI